MDGEQAPDVVHKSAREDSSQGYQDTLLSIDRKTSKSFNQIEGLIQGYKRTEGAERSADVVRTGSEDTDREQVEALAAATVASNCGEAWAQEFLKVAEEGVQRHSETNTSRGPALENASDHSEKHL